VIDVIDALAGRRLRPGVAATPLGNGLHLRGRRSSVTLEGSRALPALWRILEEALRTGDLAALARHAPAGSPVRAALGPLIAQLDSHDMLVERSAEDGGTAASRWLSAVADHPDAAAAAIASARPRVRGTGPEGPLAHAAARALARSGATPSYTGTGPAGTGTIDAIAPGHILIEARVTRATPDSPTGAPPPTGARLAVAAGLSGGMAFVTAPGTPEQARADAAALTTRLAPRPAPDPGEPPSPATAGRGGPASLTEPGPAATAPWTPANGPDPASPSTAEPNDPSPPGTADPGDPGPRTTADGDDPAPVTAAAPAGPTPLVALIAGAAAQRLLCAVAGLPDPAKEGDDPRILPDRPAVLVAAARPLRAGYHSWVGPDALDADRRAAVAAPATLGEALRRVAVLGDELVGVLGLPLPGGLPQLPAALAECAVPGGTLVAGGARVDLARLDAVCRAAELRLAVPGCTVAVGADPGHAWGRALRRAAARGRPRAGTALPRARWLAHPQAGHWWTALTERLGVRAGLSVVRVAAREDAVFHAVVRDGSGRLLGHAVEATAGDAAAFAALAAVAHAQCAEADVAVHRESRPSGASAPVAAAGAEPAGWEDDGWTTGWLAGLASREPELQTVLGRLTGLRAAPWEPVGTDARTVAAGLHGCGFTVLGTSGGAR
jgi:hypothetical protein